MEAEELAQGLWRWTAPHPDWTPEEGGPDGWEQEVGCVYLDGRNAVVLIDPLTPREGPERERFFSALDRDVARGLRPLAVLLTVFWHERSAQELLDRYPDATVWAHEPGLERLECRVTNPYRAGDVLPCGIRAFPVERSGEVVYWLPDHRALVPGDVLLGADGGGLRVCPDSWLGEGAPERVRAALRGLLDLPVELVLVSHGRPVLAEGRRMLEEALV